MFLEISNTSWLEKENVVRDFKKKTWIGEDNVNRDF